LISLAHQKVLLFQTNRNDKSSFYIYQEVRCLSEASGTENHYLVSLF
jgi:hypothetical protein